MQKIPCSECGAMILPTTAKKTGGFCMPCFRKKEAPATEPLEKFLIDGTDRINRCVYCNAEAEGKQYKFYHDYITRFGTLERYTEIHRVFPEPESAFVCKKCVKKERLIKLIGVAISIFVIFLGVLFLKLKVPILNLVFGMFAVGALIFLFTDILPDILCAGNNLAIKSKTSSLGFIMKSISKNSTTHSNNSKLLNPIQYKKFTLLDR